ncbi:PTS system fructose-specific transporter subunit IIB [Klebsiella pneumoniae]|nr:PTS system fructose-specific transporter subunit IIB [Klebsiella pneumoniae]
MKTLLIIDAGLGQARAYMAKTLLGAAAPKAHLELIDNPNDAETGHRAGNRAAGR